MFDEQLLIVPPRHTHSANSLYLLFIGSVASASGYPAGTGGGRRLEVASFSVIAS